MDGIAIITIIGLVIYSLTDSKDLSKEMDNIHESYLNDNPSEDYDSDYFDKYK